MNDGERDQLIRIVTSFEDFVRQYQKDEDRKEKQRVEFRKEIIDSVGKVDVKIDGLDERLKPIERDHNAVMFVARWGGRLGAAAGGVFGMIKGWMALRDHLR